MKDDIWCKKEFVTVCFKIRIGYILYRISSLGSHIHTQKAAFLWDLKIISFYSGKYTTYLKTYLISITCATKTEKLCFVQIFVQCIKRVYFEFYLINQSKKIFAIVYRVL
jgi:hypothetical protein